MEVSEHRPAVLMAPADWLSPSLIVSLALALIAAVLALAYLVQQRDPSDSRTAALSPPAADAAQAQRVGGQTVIRVDPATGQEIVVAPEPIEFRCVQGMRVRKQGSSYSAAGGC